ncbi:putative UBP type Zn finger protein [Allocatelliglobosispora scoriae]|uniref:Putative UBP type Zn finger protein n=1 Tax=Allocatelliglobosispora scoriae TaxID=643052 RepID=A0A841BLF3_9ACTN|nr:UBP-type zinc finger domain-containing protein [Allocatelliglobosispora scoriae]MBB5868029.1 putative UBP type Zn finger protein [Allocatelliglobosispora scoriae]
MKCSHLAEAGTQEPQTTEGCPQCVADGFTDWVHLRMCLECGNVGCCDSSPRKHARVHFEKEGHPVMRSAQPGESWRWCYIDEVVG